LNMSRNSKIALIPILSMACMYVLLTLPYLITYSNLLTHKLVQAQQSSFDLPMSQLSGTRSSSTPLCPSPYGPKSR
jgi:hypothetical protein